MSESFTPTLIIRLPGTGMPYAEHIFDRIKAELAATAQLASFPLDPQFEVRNEMELEQVEVMRKSLHTKKKH